MDGVDIGKIFLPNTDFESIGDLISEFLPLVLTIAGALVLLYLLWGGLQYIFSQGDPKEVQKARSRMTYAIIGLVVLVVAFLVLQAVESSTGIPIFGE